MHFGLWFVSSDCHDFLVFPEDLCLILLVYNAINFIFLNRLELAFNVLVILARIALLVVPPLLYFHIERAGPLFVLGEDDVLVLVQIVEFLRQLLLQRIGLDVKRLDLISGVAWIFLRDFYKVDDAGDIFFQ